MRTRWFWYFLIVGLFLVAFPVYGIVIPDCSVTVGSNSESTGQDCFAPDYTAGGSVYNSVNSVINLSGVAYVNDTSLGLACSGALISPTLVLTAGHCFNGMSGLQTYITFQDGTGMWGSSIVDPVYTATLAIPGQTTDTAWTDGADLAVVQLSAPATETVYSLYTGSLSFGSSQFYSVDLAGFGYTGIGTTGQQGAFGTLRAGGNAYETNACSFYGPGVSCNVYMGDFSANVAYNPLNGPALTDEVDLSYGDSGGPTFYNGQIIGVHDIIGCSADVYPGDPCASGGSAESYYGEVFGDASVPGNIAWINSEIAASAVPEPMTWLLCLAGLALVIRRKQPAVLR